MCTLQRLLVFTIALLLAGPTTSAWGQLPTNELEGTWKMVSQELVYPDSVEDRSNDWGANFKILNSTHFAWGRETKDSTEVLAGGGRYEYYPEEDRYIEHIQYHSDPAFAGESIEFTARVDGDTWILIGDLGDVKLREVWKRVDPYEVRAEMTAGGTTDTTTEEE